VPPDGAGRILDRFARLELIISPEVVRQAIAATGGTNPRRCTLTHEVIWWVVLAMGIFTELPIRHVFRHARRLDFGEKAPHRSSLCVARQRLGIAPLCQFFEQLVHILARPATPRSFHRGSHLVGLEGAVYVVPDSQAGAAACARPSAERRAEGAFLQNRELSLVDLGTQVDFAFALRSIAHGELSMVERLVRHLAAEMLLIWDGSIFSYRHREAVTARDFRLLARAKSNLVLRPIHNLSDGSYLAEAYRTAEDLRKDREGIVVRADPLHAGRSATGRPRRSPHPDHECVRPRPLYCRRIDHAAS
jgi:hypothetical protein